jgi:UDP-N-acetylmuramoyl-L-alanyl-D-glutamate--2,6-diaminopimelate ligase
MKLDEIVWRLLNTKIPISLEITGVTNNSRNIKPHYAFVAIEGAQTDGHMYIKQAIENGAVIIFGERESFDCGVPYVTVPDSRRFLAELLPLLHPEALARKKLIGITGTNGKTTTAYLLHYLLSSYGYQTALLGTVMNIVNEREMPSINTTMDIVKFYELMNISSDEFVVMEVSSHGIHQRRVLGIEYDVLIFTNLDFDHLDYHETMEEYFAVKASLFTQLKESGAAIINGDQKWGQQLAASIKRPLVFGQQAAIRLKSDYLKHFELSNGADSFSFYLPLAGIHNHYNCVAAVLAADYFQIPIRMLQQLLIDFTGVPGRFQIFDGLNGSRIVIDYAHTADALTQCFQTIERFQPSGITHIFGFRTNRYQAKYETMMEISKHYCSQTFLTLDKIEGHDPSALYEKYLTYLPPHQVIIDRTVAIELAMLNAEKDEWILITGMGPEPYDITFQLKTKDDIETVTRILEAFPSN